MSAHTPGNWEVINDPGHFDTATTVVSRDGGILKGLPYRMIVQVGGWAGPREAEASARLIASAPKLLEALEAVMAILPICPKNTGIAGIEARYNSAVAAAKSAIAKSTGGMA